MKPLQPTTRQTMPAQRAMWKAAKPPVKPFWAANITVTRPSSVPIMVAIPRCDFSERPATTKSLMLLT